MSRLHLSRPHTVVAVVVMALALVMAPATAAFAHAGLVGSTPENGATLESMPTEVRLTFNEEMNRPSFVTVTAPDGSVIVDGESAIEGTDLVQPLTDPELAGTYRIDYRGISADGHAVKGTLEFTVTAGAEVEQDTVTEVTSSTWWWVSLVAVPWVVLLVVLVVRRRSRA